MKSKFIELTVVSTKKAVLINIDQITWIETDDKSGSWIYLAIVRGKDLYSKSFHVKEEYAEIKNIIQDPEFTKS